MVQFCNQLDAMQSMKEQLEQRTKMIEANIQRQQDELRQIQEELQRVQGHSLQVVHETIRSRSAAAPLHSQMSCPDFNFAHQNFLLSFRCSCRKGPRG